MTRSLPQINADIKEHTRVVAGINRWLLVIVPLWLCLLGWSINQADTHYEAQAKINQEQIAWNR